MDADWEYGPGALYGIWQAENFLTDASTPIFARNIPY
jgi:hypothetical protein